MPNRKADGGIRGYKDKVCLWTEQEEGQWETTCDNTFEFFAEGPTENGFTSCPYCGGILIPEICKAREANRADD